jgi:hypothetical protein
MSKQGDSAGDDDLLPGERPKSCVYIPPSSTPALPPSVARRQHQFPVLRRDGDVSDTFEGSKRAFIAGHRRKAALAAQVADASWRVREKEHAHAYRREMDMLLTSIRVRDEGALVRSNRPRPRPSEPPARITTGPRRGNRLPREVQDTTYPRTRLRYFGAGATPRVADRTTG